MTTGRINQVTRQVATLESAGRQLCVDLPSLDVRTHSSFAEPKFTRPEADRQPTTLPVRRSIDAQSAGSTSHGERSLPRNNTGWTQAEESYALLSASPGPSLSWRRASLPTAEHTLKSQKHTTHTETTRRGES